VEADGPWSLTSRTTGKVVKTPQARDLWEKIGEAAWAPIGVVDGEVDLGEALASELHDALDVGVRHHRLTGGLDLALERRDVENFIDWKVKEEQKVAALVTGSKVVSKHLTAVMKACTQCEAEGDACFDPERNPALKREIKAARKAMVPDAYSPLPPRAGTRRSARPSCWSSGRQP
jgi:hypothetical protein